MNTTQQLLRQLELESATTRIMLSVVPDDKFDWQPHPKSMSIRRLTTHIAELPGWITITLNTDGLDIAQNKDKPINDRGGLLDHFEQELAKGRNSLQGASDEHLAADWTMRHNGRVISVRSKEDIIRMAISQIIHHRAQLGVFLRLLDIPIPGSYGPSADDMPM